MIRCPVRKVLSIGVAVALATATLGACGEKDSPAAPSPPPAPTNNNPVPGTISVSHRAVGLPIAGLTQFVLSLPDATDPDGDQLSFAWDFGDGFTGSGRSSTHTYPRGGNFLVTVTVSDGKGATADTTVAIPVESVDGTWSNTDPGGTIRTFELTQSGTSVTGTYIRNNSQTGPLSGFLVPASGITFQAGITGDDPIRITNAQISADVNTFTGTIFHEKRGGPERGLTLTWIRQPGKLNGIAVRVGGEP